MYAIIKVGGQQFVVEENQTFPVNRIAADPGGEYKIEEVLFVKDKGTCQVGSPTVDSAAVVCEIVEHFRDKKIIVFKKKRRKKYRLKQGHRQDKTILKVKSITL